MLVLSRKIGQRIVIDGRISIVVQRVAGNRVSIGIEAPDDVHILRGELQKVRGEFAAEDRERPATGLTSFLAEIDRPLEMTGREVP